mmetsp:Transcript_37059/g.110650  ORF Transcript_37059/g.110650 Transcript_37059/m.110650 type:complete len:201 (+) Transcript_37059:71-673(+)|eukprot:CAMPEP_0175261668 /NCGR_PEP_ID=MMETSP0093-20121207/40879_1 /TAXON_ID=311494 /ORGANISM="Alexandrium monilatum, Strain CCMP3105" /LENGTH=200 /DNA_ID=CAMNT_0016556135 /DNA_START=66 /DNA_END=668 /DNA_ORIENTATION=-
MATQLLAAALLVVSARAACEGPFCTNISRPCANKQVGTCQWWPHHCAKVLHGASVYCSEDHLCLCGGGTCATPEGRCEAPPVIACHKKVGTCQWWPHHCSKAIHGSAVYCSEPGHECLCGEGTCLTDHSRCKAPEPFGEPNATAAAALLGGGPLRVGKNAAAPLAAGALLLLAGLAALVAWGVVSKRKRQSVQVPQLLLG